MSSNIVIKTRAIPASSRSKDHRNSTVVRTSGGGGGGSSSSGGISGDVGLSKDIRVNAPKTGYVNPGDVLRKGMGYEQIFRKMLYAPMPATLVGKISTANDVEFGSKKGVLTYTATRNDNGAMTKAFYDNDEENILNFSEEDNSGVQIATRELEGNYTKGETYTATVMYDAGEDEDIKELTLTSKISVNVYRKWFAGLCDSAPQTSDEVRSLKSNGLYIKAGTYKFPVDKWKKIAVCIPADEVTELTLTAYPGNFIEDTGITTGPITISVEGDNKSAAIDYKMWVVQTSGLNDADTFTFKTA